MILAGMSQEGKSDLGALPGEKSLYAEDKRYPSLNGTCRVPHEKSQSQSWQVTPKSSVWALSLACPKLGCSAILVLLPSLAVLRVSYQTTPGQSTHHPQPAGTFPHFQTFLGLLWSTQTVPLAGKIPLAKPRVKPRQSPFPEGHSLCHLTRTPVHIHSQATLGRGDAVFSPKH